MEDFTNDFIEEAKQFVERIEAGLMVLEKDMTNPEAIHEIFRGMHSLKGAAGMFGFKEIERLTHELEYVYADIRDKVRKNNDHILDVSLQAVDILNSLLEGKQCTTEVEAIILEVKQEDKEADREATEKPNQDTTSQLYAILFTPQKDIFNRGVNPLATLEEIKEIGKEKIIIHGTTLSLEEQVNQKEFSSWFEIYLFTEEAQEEVDDIFLFFKEDECTILPLSEPTLSNNQQWTDNLKSKGLEHPDWQEREGFIKQLVPNDFFAAKEKVIEEETEQLHESPSTQLLQPHKNESNIHVNTQKLDSLINTVGELVVFSSELQHIIGTYQDTVLNEASEKLDMLTLKLRDIAFNIRLVPLNTIVIKLKRLIRSLSNALGKEVAFITQGMDTELDRSVISILESPILHMVRNALDHAIELPDEREKLGKPRKGLIKLYSYNNGDHVFIQIQDDGKGIDLEKVKKKALEKGLIEEGKDYSDQDIVKLIMEPGFTTSSNITKVSGRGVGLDVVKRELTNIRGDIEIGTEKGLGTIFTLRLPLTLSILDTMMVEVANRKYLIPITEVEHCFTQSHAALFAKKSRLIKYQDELVPFISLREYFHILEAHPEKEKVVVINKNDKRVAIVVDKIVGELQTVYKPLNKLLADVECFTGASILGDGSMALILNALKLENKEEPTFI